MSTPPPDDPLRKNPWAAPAAYPAPDQPASQPAYPPSYQPPYQPPAGTERPYEDPNDPYRFGAPTETAPAWPNGPAANPYADPYAPAGYQQQSPYGAYPPSVSPPGYGQPGPGQPGYSQPGYNQYGQPIGSNGKAVAGLILGITALVLFWVPFLDVVLAVLGIIFSALGMGAAKRGMGGNGQALGGLVCSIIAAIGTTIFLIVVITRVANCSNEIPGTIAYDNCINGN